MTAFQYLMFQQAIKNPSAVPIWLVGHKVANLLTDCYKLTVVFFALIDICSFWKLRLLLNKVIFLCKLSQKYDEVLF